jgi:hypothetical protein
MGPASPGLGSYRCLIPFENHRFESLAPVIVRVIKNLTASELAHQTLAQNDSEPNALAHSE